VPNTPTEDPRGELLPNGVTTLGRIGANSGSQEAIPGAADWVAGYLSQGENGGLRLTPSVTGTADSRPTGSTPSNTSRSSSSGSTSAEPSSQQPSKSNSSSSNNQAAVDNSNNSGPYGAIPLVVFSLLAIAIIGFAIRHFYRVR